LFTARFSRLENILRKSYYLTPILFTFSPTTFAMNWTEVAKDAQGIHYIDISKINYEERYETAHFKLLTNEYVNNSTKLGNTSLITEYVVYCHPQPRSYNRYKMISYQKLWGKGKVTDSFTMSKGAWNIEDAKEIAISELVCKEKRYL
jgi:hypothetical protein